MTYLLVMRTGQEKSVGGRAEIEAGHDGEVCFEGSVGVHEGPRGIAVLGLYARQHGRTGSQIPEGNGT